MDSTSARLRSRTSENPAELSWEGDIGILPGQIVKLGLLLFRGGLRLEGTYVGVTAVEVFLQCPCRGEQRVGNLDVLRLNNSICLAQLGLVLLEKRLTLRGRQPQRQFALFAKYTG